MKLLILAGTADGRLLAEHLTNSGFDLIVSTLTDYGADLVQEKGMKARYGAFNAESLSEMLQSGGFGTVVDATHPFAVNIHKLARAICAELNIPYYRWQRPKTEFDSHSLIHWADRLETAAQKASILGHRIMLTTGSNSLAEWLALPEFKEKEIFVRVLPTAKVMTFCEKLGLKPRQIIAAQGPFSAAWNEAMFSQLKIDAVIAKDSGPQGGTSEKIQACLKMNIPIVLLQRPEPTDIKLSIEKFIRQLEGDLHEN